MIVTDFDQLSEVVTAYKEFDAFCFDVETIGADRLNPRTNQVLWVSLAGPGRADAIPMGHPLGNVSHWERPVTKTGKVSVAASAIPAPVHLPPPPQLRPGAVFQVLSDLFFSDRRKIGHNLKFDLCSIRKYYGGKLPPPPYASTDVAAFLLNENHTGNKPYALANCCKRDLGFTWEKSFGAMVEMHPFSIAARYGYFDAKYAWLLWRRYEQALENEKLTDLFELEMDVLRVVCDMETTGIHIDVDAIKRVDRELREEIEDTYNKIRKVVDWDINLNANAEVAKLVYEVLGHKPVLFTPKTGAPSTAAKAFEPFIAKDPIVKAVAHWTTLHKTHATFVVGIRRSLTKEGKIHGSFNQRGAKTGRFSCVSGATLLEISRGVFRLDEYVPVRGDLVQTHTGALRPVLRKIYKGRDYMFRVCLADGSALECTQDHRLLTPGGWRRVGDLRPGSVVWSYGRLEEVCGESQQREVGAPHLLWAGEADVGRDGSAGGHHVPQRAVHRKAASSTGEAQARESVAILSLEDGRPEPDAPQEWLLAPQLQGAGGGWPRLLDEEGQGQVPPVASAGIPAGAAEEWFQFLRGASHRRRSEEQLSGQPGASDADGTPGVACQAVEIREITPLGAMGVWDIEVGGEHSYLAQGFLNHNSDHPNMQNIPIRQDKTIRGMFMAPDGYRLIVADYSQIELRFLAHYSQDPMLLKAYNEGLDLHHITATRAYRVKAPTERQRSLAKNVNFSMVYGGGPGTIMARYEVPYREAEKLINAFFDTYRRVKPWTKTIIQKCKSQRVSEDYAKLTGKTPCPPYVTTILGRRRRLPQIFWTDRELRGYAERQAVNTVIQGSAGDLNKIAMVEVGKVFRHRNHEVPAARHWLLLLTIHDELVALVPEDDAEEARDVMKEVMENLPLPVKLRVPLVVDAKICRRWSEAKG